MRLIETDLPEVKLIEPDVFSDDRGFFLESWNARAFAALGLDLHFVQDNHSRSMRGVLRGLHYQLEKPQGKLVRVSAGRAYDVVVDLRRASPRFGQWFGAELSADNKRLLWIPPGFAHGFLCLQDDTDFVYKCTEFYNSGLERTLLWSDPKIGIEWPLQNISELIISRKDAAGLALNEADSFA